MSAMWKKWFGATAAFGVELYALNDCGLGCLVGHPVTTVKERVDSIPPGNSRLSAKLDCLVEETARALKHKLVVVDTG